MVTSPHAYLRQLRTLQYCTCVLYTTVLYTKVAGTTCLNVLSACYVQKQIYFTRFSGYFVYAYSCTVEKLPDIYFQTNIRQSASHMINAKLTKRKMRANCDYDSLPGLHICVLLFVYLQHSRYCIGVRTRRYMLYNFKVLSGRDLGKRTDRGKRRKGKKRRMGKLS